MGKMATVIVVALMVGAALYIVLQTVTGQTTKEGKVPVTAEEAAQAAAELETEIAALRERLVEARNTLQRGRGVWDDNGVIHEAQMMAERIASDVDDQERRLGEKGQAIKKDAEALAAEARNAKRRGE